MIDFHTHILPGVDDGSHNVRESITMLKASYAQGIDTVVLSSHFRLGEHRIKSWLRDREDSLSLILEELTEEDKLEIPRMILGAEVEYIAGMNRWDYLDELVIDGTDYIMTEMPFIPWTDAVVKTIDDIALNSGLTPILPHIDRYFHTFTKEAYIRHYYEMPVKIQMNAIYINNYSNIQFFKPLLDDGTVHILGSDCHSCEWRPPDLGRAIRMVEEVCGKKVLDEIDARGREILKGAKYVEF
jgi:protein-tyrosine phosphatase